eukprot:6176560-Pleurochrysis_carterae.AAC.1
MLIHQGLGHRRQTSSSRPTTLSASRVHYTGTFSYLLTPGLWSSPDWFPPTRLVLRCGWGEPASVAVPPRGLEQMHACSELPGWLSAVARLLPPCRDAAASFAVPSHAFLERAKQSTRIARSCGPPDYPPGQSPARVSASVWKWKAQCSRMLQQPVRWECLQLVSKCPDQTVAAVPASRSVGHTAGDCCWTGCAPIAAASPGSHLARPTNRGTRGPRQLVHHHVRSARGTALVGRLGLPHE